MQVVLKILIVYFTFLEEHEHQNPRVIFPLQQLCQQPYAIADAIKKWKLIFYHLNQSVPVPQHSAEATL